MELRHYATILIKWLWMIILGAFLVGGAAFAVSRNNPPVYQASTTLMVSLASNYSNTSYDTVLVGQQLAKTYSELLKKRPVLERVVQDMDLAIAPDQLARSVTVQMVRDTQLIVLQVENQDPVLAARVADRIAKIFIEQNEAAQLSRFTSSKENLLTQLKQIQLDLSNAQIALDGARATTNVSEVTRWETSLAQLRSSYSSLLQSYEEIRVNEAKSIDTIAVVESAAVPTSPVRPNVMTNTLLAAVIGAMLAAGNAFLIEYLDDRIRSSEQVDAALHLPTLGAMTRLHATSPEDCLTVHKEPRSTQSEAYRMLRTNIQFSNVDRPPKTILVTSAGPQEGKSTTAANLAAAMAQGGAPVALIDTDLRRPTLHRIFGTGNDHGLTTALLNSNYLNGSIQQTQIEQLCLLPTGPIPPNPSELLNSQRMQTLIADLKRQYAVVIFDSPPVLVVADASILAPQMDAVILVIDAGQTRRDAAQRAASNLRQVGSHLIGVVLNRLSPMQNRLGYSDYAYLYRSDPKKGRQHSARPKTLSN